MITAADLRILRYLAKRARATASQIGTACAMSEDEAGMHLVMLEFMQLVAGQPSLDGETAKRGYTVTLEGRRKAIAASI